jgi:hypothetical protein
MNKAAGASTRPDFRFERSKKADRSCRGQEGIALRPLFFLSVPCEFCVKLSLPETISQGCRRINEYEKVYYFSRNTFRHSSNDSFSN